MANEQSDASSKAQCATFPYPNDVDHWRARALKAEAELAVLKAAHGGSAKVPEGWRQHVTDAADYFEQCDNQDRWEYYPSRAADIAAGLRAMLAASTSAGKEEKR